MRLRFRVGAEDQLRVWIDGNLLLDEWAAAGASRDISDDGAWSDVRQSLEHASRDASWSQYRSSEQNFDRLRLASELARQDIANASTLDARERLLRRREATQNSLGYRGVRTDEARVVELFHALEADARPMYPWLHALSVSKAAQLEFERRNVSFGLRVSDDEEAAGVRAYLNGGHTAAPLHLLRVDWRPVGRLEGSCQLEWAPRALAAASDAAIEEVEGSTGSFVETFALDQLQGSGTRVWADE